MREEGKEHSRGRWGGRSNRRDWAARLPSTSRLDHCTGKSQMWLSAAVSHTERPQLWGGKGLAR